MSRPVRAADDFAAAELGDDARPAQAAVVVDGGDVGQGDGVGDQSPQAAVPLADLGFRDVVPAGLRPVSDTLDRKVLMSSKGASSQRQAAIGKRTN